MKDKTLRRFRYKVTLEIILKFLACFAALGIFLFLVDNIFNDLLAELLYRTNGRLYYVLTQNKWVIITGLMVLLLLVSIYFTIMKMSRYILMMVKAIDQVFQKDQKLISLPPDFAEIENKLNTIKYESLRNEQAAREADQRKNDLVVYLAHDLKTPLTSVIGYLSLLSEEQEIPPELRRKYVNISLDKAQRLESLINEFFEITRFSLQNIELEPEEVSLSMMLRQLAEEFYPQLTEKGLRCEVEEQEEVRCYGDADKLARVFDNLLRNALLYSRKNSLIRIGLWEVEEQVVIKFRNVGKRIPESKLKSIFEKFYRLDDARSTQTGGAGLGLAIAKEIVELHGGAISAQSNEQYTEFTVCLPARRDCLEVHE